MPLNNPSIEDRISDIDERVKTLEHGNKQDEILDILNKIKARLIGDIEGESPGLIPDVRQLKKDSETTKNQLTQINDHIQEIKKNQSGRMDFEREIKEIKKRVENITKWGLISYGILLALGWVIANSDKISLILKAMKGP